MRNRSVLQIVDSFLPVIGGKQLVVHWLASYLNKSGFPANVFAGGLGEKNDFEHNYRISRFPARPRAAHIPRNLAFLMFTRLRFRPGILHAHTAFPAGYYAALSKKFSEAPLVITCTGEDILTVPEINYGASLNPVIAKRIEFALKSADVLIAKSEGIKETIMELGIPKEKIRSIPNGIDLNRFSQNNTDPVENRKSKTLLAIGKYRRVKGFEELLKITALVAKDIPDIKCVIVGKGMEVLNPLISELNLRENVQISEESFDYNNIESEDFLRSFYNSSSVYVSASLSESFSSTILESMAMGVPVVSTETPGAKGLIEHEKTGMLSPVGNVEKLSENILRVLQDEELRDTIIQNALAKTRDYSWELVANKHIDLYDSLLSENN